MKKRRMFRALYTSICLCTIFICLEPVDAHPRAEAGLLDLRSVDLSDEGIIRLDGEWEFHWGKLLEPPFPPVSGVPGGVSSIRVPRPWNEAMLDDRFLPGKGHATFRLRVLTRDNSRVLGIKLNQVLMAGKVFIDDSPVGTIGLVGTGPAGMVSQRRVGLFFFRPAHPSFNITIQVSNYHYIKGGIKGSIELGYAESLQSSRETLLAFDLFLLGSLLIIALYHFGLYIFRRRDFPVLFFGVFCLLFATRSLLTGEIPLTVLFPDIDWMLMIRWELLNLYLSGMAGVLFYHSLYPVEFKRLISRVLILISAAFCLAALFAPMGILTETLMPYLLLMSVILVYIIGCLVLASMRGRDDAPLFLAGFAFIFISALNDTLLSLDVLDTVQIIHFGYFLYVISQSFVLSRRFAHALTTVERQSGELTEANEAYRKELEERLRIEDELKRYRTQLEELVLERTFELEKANVRLQAEMVERKKAEDELIKAGKIESLGVFAGGIAHDFNNLLTAIMGNLSIARLELSDDEKLFSIVKEAEKASERARDLTRQLLTFSRGGMPVRRPSSMGSVIRDTADFILRGSSIRCDYDIAVDLWDAEVDINQIGQVIHNLVINALQAMPDGGRMNIEAANAVMKPGDVATLREGRYIKISVTDNGVGINSVDLVKIFDPYFTTKKEGSGLGLAISYSIVSKHEGAILVRSTPGRGTTFSVYLPAADEMTERIPRAPGADSVKPGRVLVMDDDEAVIKTLVFMLEKLGMDSTCAKDGAEALALYEESAGNGEPFSAVIMDLTVPGGMGGKDAVRILKSKHPGAKVIVSSGYSNDPVLANYRRYGFDEVLLKPFGYENVVEVLRKVTVQ